MKKIYYVIIILTIGLLHACTNEIKDIFDEPASVRMANALRDYKNLLVSSPNGWLVEYYPQSSQAYGGYNLFFKFTENEVIVKSEVQSPLLTVDEATSTYSLGEDMGPTLNFDTYNAVFNFFSDPALAVGGGTGFGYEGDYEFVFMSGDASEIILKGKKTRNIIRLTPFPSGITWQEYVDKVQSTRDAFTWPGYGMTVNGKAVTSMVKPSSTFDRFTISYEDNGEVISSKIAYIVLPTGIRFYEPLTINGVTVQDFIFNATTKQMVSTDGKAVINIVYPPLSAVFVTSLTYTDWYLSSAAMGSEFLTAFQAMKSQITSNLGEQLAYTWIGTSVSTSKPSFSFGSYDGSQVWYGSILLNATEVTGQNNQIKIVILGTSEVNGNWYIGYAPLLGTFINSLAGTYTVTTQDPPDNIQTVTLTDVANSDRWLTLTQKEVVFP